MCVSMYFHLELKNSTLTYSKFMRVTECHPGNVLGGQLYLFPLGGELWNTTKPMTYVVLPPAVLINSEQLHQVSTRGSKEVVGFR